MLDRREVMIGMLGAGAFGVAEYLRPRQTIRLFKGMELAKVVPDNFGVWQEHAGGGVVVPTTPDSLADRLYSATLSRIYYPTDGSGPPVMLLVAYGGEQSDLLQLHRPESCYPAVGLGIVSRKLADVQMDGGGEVPSVFLTAANQDRLEDIVYWTRLGESLPRTAAEQRADRLQTAMRGQIGDGILVRASTLRAGDQPMWPYLANFLAQLVAALPPKARPGFVGTKLASSIA